MKSWVQSANNSNCHFPIQNLPFGVAKLHDSDPVCVTAIGDFVLNLAALESAGLLDAGVDYAVFNKPYLNDFMSLGAPTWKAVRLQLTKLLVTTSKPNTQKDIELWKKVLVKEDGVAMCLAFRVAEYTDFYAGKQHAKNVGMMFRGMDDLPANWLHIPIGYNGRASSIVVSGTDIHRPYGQLKTADELRPRFSTSEKVDFELEIGAVVGCHSELGRPISVSEADEMIFGFVLLNDWSARDIQAWEYQPLGPFQSKAFGTSIGAWIVTKEALEPFRLPQPPQDEELLPYLQEEIPGFYDINLQVTLQPERAVYATTICQTNSSRLYYSSAQQLAHHALGGCKMNIGDLLGSGTISGPEKSEFGSMLELSWNGTQHIALASGHSRTFIEDNDRVTFTGFAEGNGYKVGFGECSGRILPAVKVDQKWLRK